MAAKINYLEHLLLESNMAANMELTNIVNREQDGNIIANGSKLSSYTVYKMAPRTTNPLI